MVKITKNGIAYKDKIVPFNATFQDVCGAFDPQDICISNSKNSTFIKIRSDETQIDIHWYKSLEPITISITHDEVDLAYWPKIDYSYRDIFQQCQLGQLELQLHVAFSYRKEITPLTINKNTTINEIAEKFVECNVKYWLFSNKNITFYDSMLDDIRCMVKITFNDNDTVEYVQLVPCYHFPLDPIGETVASANHCKDKLMQESDYIPIKSVINADEFGLIYDFPHTTLCANLTFNPRDMYPEWSGIMIVFKNDVK